MERRLGRGLGSLLGQTQDAGAEGAEASETPRAAGATQGAESATPSVGQMLSVGSIRRNPNQPRTTFDSDALEELRASVKRHGVLQPITVRRAADGYQIVAGERRWRAARSAGLDMIPAIIKEEIDDAVSLELAIVENVQRQDLDALEKARGYRALMDQIGMKQDDVAKRVGVSRSAVANQMRLLELPEDAQEALAAGLISMGHARALLAITEERALLGALDTVVRKELSVRDTEALARETSKGSKSAGQATAASKGVAGDVLPAVAPWVGELESRLRAVLGVKVTLRNRRGYRGSITLDYANRDELERLCDRIAPKEELR